MKYLYCYDIANPKRLTMVAKQLAKEGIRIQKSFFLCDIDYDQARLLLFRLKELLNLRQDSLFMFGLCEKCQKHTLKAGDGAFSVMREYKIL